MRFANLFQEFLDSEKAGGLVLAGCTVLSLVIANSAWAEPYIHFWHQKLNLSFSGVSLNLTVEHWINDGLMAVFFLLVGLEIEREIYVGELSDVKNAIVPIGAAVGGMLIPAAIHFMLNRGTPTQNGYGIPMATDIAFALGMLALLGKRVPHSLKIFLTALAIIDDLGAVLVIAVFYNTGISWLYLGLAMGLFAVLLLLNRLKVYKLFPYLFLGLVMWYCMLQSGVHATLSGVLLAFAIPFGKNDEHNPSYHLQHILHKPVAFGILPLFALANTGIVLNSDWYSQLASSNSVGIIIGLVAGKPIGIVLLSGLMVWLGWGRLPEGTTWAHIVGAGLLGGIGFTMSIFISNLAFQDAGVVQFSKIAVLVASLMATLFGLSVLMTAKKQDVLKNNG